MIDPRNYIPGCASYTKASEISSLQKYLKKGIKKRDEALKLPENPEELNKDPLVPGIKELPKGAVGLHDPREVTELLDHSLKIVNPREESLEVHHEDIQGAETPGLLETAVGLTDNREPALESRREDINVPEVDSLEDHREGITNEHDITELPGTRLNINQTLTPELSETRLDINKSFTPELPEETLKTPGEFKEPESLENTRLGLEGDLKQPRALEGTKLETPGSETSHEITNLPDSVIEGPKTLDVSLVDYRENIESNEDPGSLEDHRENISDERNVSLENHKESVEDHRKVTLEDHRENLEDGRNVVLEDHRENLEDKRNPKLGTHRDILEDSRNVSLEDHKDVLENKWDPSLETRREVLEDKRSPKLETKKDIIEDKRNVGLDDTQLKAPGKQKTPELSGTVISGPEVKEVGLEKSRISLEDKRGVTLENHRENITDKRNPKLETRRENITDNRNPELPGTIIGLIDKRNVSLETDRETTEDSRVPELSEVREDIKVPGTPDLPVTSVGLEAGSDVALGEYQEKLTGVQDISGLPGDSEDMPGEVSDPELETTKITRPGIDSEVVLPTDSNKLEGTTEAESLEDERLNLADDRETVLPEGILPIEGEVPETTALEDTVLERPGETPDLNQIYSDTSGKELYPLEGLDVELPDIRLDITNPNEPFLEDEQLPMEPNASVPGWDGSLEDTVIPDGGDQNPIGWDESLEDERLDIKSPDTPELVTIPKIKSEPEDNWTIEVDKNPEGWDGELVTIPDIKSETDDNWTVEPNQNPIGWDESLVTIDDIKAEPEDNWTVEPDQNPEGWNEALVTTDDIKSEPEDNWTVEPDQNPEGWNEALVTVEDIISETEDNWTVEPDKNPEGWNGELITVGDIKSEPEDNWTIEADQNPEGWNEALVTTSDIKAEPEDNWTIEPDKNEVGWNESLEDERLDITDVNEILDGLDSIEPYASDTTRSQRGPSQTDDYVDIDQERRGNDTWPDDFSQDSAKAYGAKTETPEMMDPSQPNMATPNPWETGSDLNYIDTRKESDLKQYGADTESPEARPDHKDPDLTDDPNWKHIDTPDMSQGEFKDYSEGSTRDDLPKESNTGTYVSREDGSQLSQYGAKTAVAESMAPDVVAGDLGKAFNWSSENMGRSGWHLDDLAIPAYKLGGSFTSFLNPSKYLRFLVEKTVGAIPLKGSLKQWILNEALAGLIAARDKLEESLNLQPYRLPGSNEYAIQLLRQSMSGVDLKDVQNVVGNVASNLLSKETVIIKNPVNRPGKEDKTQDGRGYRWEAMQTFESKDGQNPADTYIKANIGKDMTSSTAKKIAEVVTKALGSNQGLADYFPSYFNDTGVSEASSLSKDFGMSGTLNNLTKWQTTKIESFDELKTALENSPYATTSSRLYGKTAGSIHRHDTVMTLDSNHVWEIIFEPYLGPENGKRSFLPSIQQINYENFYGFGINTNWSTWVPFTSFELNSRKMVQKNLSLYSGEISIPQNLEFTNELRLVICDDQYKSWKRYFNMVMDASTYLCEVHDEAYYKKVILKDIAGKRETFRSADVVDYYKGVVRPAPYKNLTFRCKILSMNPQFQTVNMSDLLVVLKDFTEEWQGEVDSSQTELALMFSVVGENQAAEVILRGNSREKQKNNKVVEAEQNGKWLQYSAGKVISL